MTEDVEVRPYGDGYGVFIDDGNPEPVAILPNRTRADEFAARLKDLPDEIIRALTSDGQSRFCHHGYVHDSHDCPECNAG